MKKYYREHKEYFRKRNLEWKKSHKEEYNKYMRNYLKSHKEKRTAYKKKCNQLCRDYYYKHKEKYMKYKNSEEKRKKYNEYHRQYSKTENGKKIKRISSLKRRRNKKFIQILPNIFPEEIPIAYHHIDGKIFVVPLPEKIHRKGGSSNIDYHIDNSNQWIEFYYDINPNNIINDVF